MTRSRSLPVAAVGLALAGLALTACSAGTSPDAGRPVGHAAHPTAPLPPVDVETGLVHVHGLGVDPADGVLYAATHSGVFRVPEQGPPERIANRAQDTMGFAVVGPGTFLGSGHPDPREDDVRPPLLGLIESDDAGRTWRRLSLHGQADFHALAVAHDRVYGFDATSSTFMVSSDKRDWDRRAQLPLRDFAVDPADPEHVVGTVEQGVIVSTDGGRSWSGLAGAPRLVLVSWTPVAGLVGVDREGALHRSADAGRSWTRTGSADGAPEALVVDERDGATTVFVAVMDRGILASSDGGRSFAVRYDAAGG